MNWKLIIQLSFFGLIMAFATISLIPYKIEPAFWLVIFVFSAYVIAKVCTGKYFLQGFIVSLINCLWITLAHFWFYDSYAANHADVVAMYTGNHQRQKLLEFAPIFGVACGIIQGLFAFVASKMVKKKLDVAP